MARLVHSLYKNVDHPNGIKRPNHISPTLFDQYWRGHFTNRTRIKHSLFKNHVFEELLLRMGIQENAWWHREDQDILLHDATNDVLHEHPVMPSLMHNIQIMNQRTQDQITLLDSMIQSATTHGVNDRKQKAQQAKVRKQERDKLKKDQHQQHSHDPCNSSRSSASSSNSQHHRRQQHQEKTLTEEKKVIQEQNEPCYDDIADQDEDEDYDDDDDNTCDDVGELLYDESVDASLDSFMSED